MMSMTRVSMKIRLTSVQFDRFSPTVTAANESPAEKSGKPIDSFLPSSFFFAILLGTFT